MKEDPGRLRRTIELMLLYCNGLSILKLVRNSSNEYHCLFKRWVFVLIRINETLIESPGPQVTFIEFTNFCPSMKV